MMLMERRKVLSVGEVISIKGGLSGLLRDEIGQLVSDERKRVQQECLHLPLTYDEFRELFISFGTYCLLKNNRKETFIIDDQNDPVIHQLYYYVTNDRLFAGELHKGIMLQGKYGCGKTVVLETFTHIHNYIIRRFSLRLPMLTFIKSVNLQEQIIKQSMQNFMRKPLAIDEFGRESKAIQDYGNVLRPVSELLSVRSDIGVKTHGTTNFTLETLSSDEFYGKMIGDRLKMMFNFIRMEGDSRRK